MSDHIPSEPRPSDFRETSERSQAANIANESPGYGQTATNSDGRQRAEPGAGEEGTVSPNGDRDPVDLASDGAPAAEPGVVEPSGQMDTPTRDDSPDESDSIEPFHIPGSVEDIEVAGETGPGPSG
jgi:hypothetical protein